MLQINLLDLETVLVEGLIGGLARAVLEAMAGEVVESLVGFSNGLGVFLHVVIKCYCYGKITLYAADHD